MQNIKTQALVLGSGPGGYVAAIRLGQLGVDTVLVEASRVGGVCLNVGCIPSKALISAVERGLAVRHGTHMGVEGDIRWNTEALGSHRDVTVEALTSGVEKILESYGVKIVKGWGSFVQPGLLQVEGDEPCEITYEQAIVAAGSEAVELPMLPFSHPRVWNSTDALSLKEIPGTLVVIGGGVIGLELGSVYAALGAEVTVVEMMKNVLPGVPKTAAKLVQRSMKKNLGVRFMTGSKVTGAEADDSGITLTVEDAKGRAETVRSDAVLVAVGRRPRLLGYGLENLGVDVSARYLDVPETLEFAPGHYAIGDLTGPPLLAHRASRMGEVAAERIAGRGSVYRPRAMPQVAYTSPEVAVVGKTAEECSEPVRSGRFQFRANGRALAHGDADGFVEVIARESDDVIVGVVMVGPMVSELSGEAALAVEAGITARALGEVVHPHPTMSEALMEAARAVGGEAIHQMRPR